MVRKPLKSSIHLSSYLSFDFWAINPGLPCFYFTGHKCAAYTLSSMSSQTFSVSPASSNLWTFVLICDAKNSRKLFFLGFSFVVFDFILFLPKMHDFSEEYTVMSLCSVHYNQRKQYKTLCQKIRYVLNSLTQQWKYYITKVWSE